MRPRHLLPLLCLPLVSLLCGGVRADSPSLPSADAAFASGKFDQARKSYAFLIKTDPKSDPAYTGLIQSELRMDRWRDALKIAQDAVNADPKSANAFGLLALVEIRAGEPEQADISAKTALFLDKDNYWGLVASARIASWNGDDHVGYTLFQRATALHPERPDAWLGLIQTQNDSTTSEQDLAVDNHYLALKPQGQPFDFTTPFIQNLVTNETGYWHSFHDDKAYHLSKTDEKQASYTAVFPIQREGNYVLVSVAINGKPFHLLFDSGAGEILLTKNAAKRLRLPDLAKSYVSGLQGRGAAALQKADTLSLGSITLQSIPLHVTDGYAGPGDGLFGGAILHDYAVTLDFDNSIMIIARGPGAKHLALPHSSVSSMPMHFYDSHLFVSTHAGDRRIWAMVDTGAETDFFSLDLTHALSADTPKADWHEGSFDSRSGIGDSAMSVDYCLTPQKVTLTFDGSSPPATLTQDGLIGQSSIDHQTSPDFDFEVGFLLGVPVLSQHSRVTIDYPNRLLTFEDPLP
jgi:tetratricopeptide (TPR) repeat protein